MSMMFILSLVVMLIPVPRNFIPGRIIVTFSENIMMMVWVIGCASAFIVMRGAARQQKAEQQCWGIGGNTLQDRHFEFLPGNQFVSDIYKYSL